MFVTPERVTRITGYEGITLKDIAIAQTMLEAYIGRMEARVTDADDKEIMAVATAYQAVYVKMDSIRVFELAKVDQIVQDSNMIRYKTGDEDSPFIAPLAVMAMRNLTWRRSTSVKIGRGMNARPWPEYDWKRD